MTKDIESIAYLARLRFSDEEQVHIEEYLKKRIKGVQILYSIVLDKDVKDPIQDVQFLRCRFDEATQGAAKEHLQDLAPDFSFEEGYVVPRVIDES